MNKITEIPADQTSGSVEEAASGKNVPCGTIPKQLPSSPFSGLVAEAPEKGVTDSVPVEAFGSQAPEDQAAVISEMCRHVERVMKALSSQDAREWPSDAFQAVEQLKGKMISFAVQGSTEKGQRNQPRSATRRTDMSDSDSESEFKTLCPRDSRDGFRPVPKLNEGVNALRLGNLSIEERFIRALEKMDGRTVPAPEPYDLSSGRSFSSFLSLFEDYCQHSFRGSQSLWVAELGRYLTGSMRRAFDAHRAHDDSYISVRTKLLKWCEESETRRQAGSKAMFTRASMRSDETPRLFAARLENLYRQAFPEGNVRSSRTLLDKFLHSIPRKHRKQLKSSIVVTTPAPPSYTGVGD